MVDVDTAITVYLVYSLACGLVIISLIQGLHTYAAINT